MSWFAEHRRRGRCEGSGRVTVRSLAPFATALFAAATGLAAQDPAALGSIRGIVFDSLVTGSPLIGAEVELLELGRRVETNGQGAFRFDRVPGGRYTISFTHPTLSSIGFTPPERIVQLGPGIDIVYSLATPSGSTIYRRLCPGAHEPTTGVLLGVFSDAATGAAVPGAQVRGEWTETTLGRTVGIARRQRIVTASADSSGRFQLCGVPTDVPVLIRGAVGSRLGPPLELRMEGRVVAVRPVSLDLTDSTGRGTATATGTVSDAKGEPIANVQVLVLGTERSTRTDEHGWFTLTGLPAGTATIEARAIGYARGRAPVELRRGGETKTAFTLTRVAVELPEVSTEGKAAPFSGSGFEERRARRTGYFISRADIVRRGTARVEDLFKTVPGLKVEPIGGTDYQIVSLRGGSGVSSECAPLVYLDRFPLVLDPETTGGAIPLAPEEIAGIEVYQAPADAPPEFQRVQNSCAIILIWTRRGRQ